MILAYGFLYCEFIFNKIKYRHLSNNSIDAAVTIGHQNNKAQLINQEANDLAAKAAVTPDGPEREAMYYRIQEILFEECAYVTTAHNALYTCGWKGTGGAVFYSTSYNDYSMAYRIIE